MRQTGGSTAARPFRTGNTAKRKQKQFKVEKASPPLLRSLVCRQSGAGAASTLARAFMADLVLAVRNGPPLEKSLSHPLQPPCGPVRGSRRWSKKPGRDLGIGLFAKLDSPAPDRGCCWAIDAMPAADEHTAGRASVWGNISIPCERGLREPTQARWRGFRAK